MRLEPEGRKPLRALRDVLLTVLLLAVAFVAWRFVYSSAGAVRGGAGISPLPTATEAAPATLTPIPAATIQAMLTRRANLISVEKTRRSPLYTPQVTTDWARLRREEATLAAKPRPTQALHTAFPGQTLAGAGWLGRGLPTYYNSGFGVTNLWHEVSAGGMVNTDVIAGGTYADPARASPGPQGLLVVEVWQMAQDRLSDSMVYQKMFLTPTASGEVTITGAQGERVILQSTGGTVFYFDVPTRQFVPSLAATVTAPPPTTGPVSPLATGTPAP